MRESSGEFWRVWDFGHGKIVRKRGIALKTACKKGNLKRNKSTSSFLSLHTLSSDYVYLLDYSLPYDLYSKYLLST